MRSELCLSFVYGTMALMAALGWLSPVALRALTVTFTFAPIGRFWMTTSLSCVSTLATSVLVAVLTTRAR